MAWLAVSTLSSRKGNWSSCQTPFPLVLLQHIEELEQLDRVQAAGDEVVVPGAVVVVDVHAEQAAVVDGHLGRVGRRLAAEHGMAEIEQDADIGQADLLDAQQRAGARESKLMCTRGSRGLYSMTNLRSGFSLGELADAIERVLPQRRRDRPGTGSPSRPGRARA